MTADNRDETKLREAEEDTLPEILSPAPEEAEEDEEYREEEIRDDEADELVKELKGEEKNMKNAQRFLIYLVIFLVVVWLLFFKIIGITHMPSEAMEPRIDPGDLMIFFRLDKDAEFEDVIVFEKDLEGNGAKTMLVGRVMAGPGDTVEISDSNRLIVNGNVIVESTSYRSDIAKRGDRVAYPLTLAEDEYFVITDNRQQGVDSRYFGPVKKKEVLGTVITLIRRNRM